MTTRSLPLILLLAVTACAATSVQEVPMPNLEVRLTQPKKARAYIFRSEREDFAGYGALLVAIDDERIGMLGPDRFFCVELKPGLRRIRMVHEPTGQPRRYGLEILDAKAGQVYHCEISFPFDRNHWPQLAVLEKGEARRALRRLEPAPVEVDDETKP